MLQTIRENYGITGEDLSFSYEGHTVVSRLNFRVMAGDYLCVVGENGSGKSTLIRGILALKAPEGGRILREGIKAREIGYLPQQRIAQKDFPAGVYEVVLSGRLGMGGLRPFYSRRDKQAAEENLLSLGIADLRNRCYRELSGGQQQRVLLARALCAGRKLLILDEPAAGLDPPATAELYRLLSRINRETGMALIMVSHDLEGVLQYASHVLHLKNEALFYGTAGEYARSETGRAFSGGLNGDGLFREALHA
jgi:zinc transport system ATP-binding protein